MAQWCLMSKFNNNDYDILQLYEKQTFGSYSLNGLPSFL